MSGDGASETSWAGRLKRIIRGAGEVADSALFGIFCMAVLSPPVAVYNSSRDKLRSLHREHHFTDYIDPVGAMIIALALVAALYISMLAILDLSMNDAKYKRKIPSPVCIAGLMVIGAASLIATAVGTGRAADAGSLLFVWPLCGLVAVGGYIASLYAVQKLLNRRSG